jgi:hypothetical protein
VRSPETPQRLSFGRSGLSRTFLPDLNTQDGTGSNTQPENYGAAVQLRSSFRNNTFFGHLFASTPLRRLFEDNAFLGFGVKSPAFPTCRLLCFELLHIHQKLFCLGALLSLPTFLSMILRYPVLIL